MNYRGSRFVLTRELTMRAKPGTLSCFPDVMTSHFWLGLVGSQGISWMGVRFSRKSPESGSTEKHWPLEVYVV